MKTFFIVNPNAGHGRAAREWPKWAGHPSVAGWAWTEEKGSATRLAAMAAQQGCPCIAACGGDGTVNEVLNALMPLPPSERPALAMLPGGTADDFARTIGVPLAWPEAFVAITAGNTGWFDVGRVIGSFGTRYFAVAAFIGAAAQMAAGANTHGKPITGIAGYLPYLLGSTRFRAAVSITTPDHQWNGDALSVQFANAPTGGGGMKVCPPARVDDGLLDAVIVEPGSPTRIARLLMLVPSGRYMRLPFVHHFTCTTAWIEGDSVDIAVDGEIIGKLPVCVEILPGALQVVVPTA